MIDRYDHALQAVQTLEDNFDSAAELDYEPVLSAIQSIKSVSHCLRYPAEIDILYKSYFIENYTPDVKYIRGMLNVSIHVNGLVTR